MGAHADLDAIEQAQVGQPPTSVSGQDAGIPQTMAAGGPQLEEKPAAPGLLPFDGAARAGGRPAAQTPAPAGPAPASEPVQAAVPPQAQVVRAGIRSLDITLPADGIPHDFKRLKGGARLRLQYHRTGIGAWLGKLALLGALLFAAWSICRYPILSRSWSWLVARPGVALAAAVLGGLGTAFGSAGTHPILYPLSGWAVLLGLAAVFIAIRRRRAAQRAGRG